MSVVTDYYVILGYDLTNYKTNKLYDWFWTDDGEKMLCYQCKGNIQLFHGSESSNHLFLGYIVANGNDYDFDTVSVGIDSLVTYKEIVDNKLNELINLGLLDIEAKENLEFKLHIFSESS